MRQINTFYVVMNLLLLALITSLPLDLYVANKYLNFIPFYTISNDPSSKPIAEPPNAQNNDTENKGNDAENKSGGGENIGANNDQGQANIPAVIPYSDTTPFGLRIATFTWIAILFGAIFAAVLGAILSLITRPKVEISSTNPKQTPNVNPSAFQEALLIYTVAAISSFVMLTLLIGGLLSGDLFPSFQTDFHNITFGPNKWGKLLFWCFRA